MDYIRLHQVIRNIAEHVQVNRRNDASHDLVKVAKYSKAAAILHAALHNSQGACPKIWRRHEITKERIVMYGIFEKLMAMLVYVSQWLERKESRMSSELQMRNGGVPESEIAKTLADDSFNADMYPHGGWYPRYEASPFRIVLKRSDVISFLTENEIAHSFASVAARDEISMAQDVELTPFVRRARHDVTRERGVRRRILEKWAVIEEEYGPRIDGHCVHIVLKRETDEKKIQLKTIQNKLIELRKEGLIP